MAPTPAAPAPAGATRPRRALSVEEMGERIKITDLGLRHDNFKPITLAELYFLKWGLQLTRVGQGLVWVDPIHQGWNSPRILDSRPASQARVLHSRVGPPPGARNYCPVCPAPRLGNESSRTHCMTQANAGCGEHQYHELLLAARGEALGQDTARLRRAKWLGTKAPMRLRLGANMHMAECNSSRNLTTVSAED